MNIKIALLCPVLALTACSGGSNTSVEPIASTGFATATDREESSITFKLNDVRRLITSPAGETTIELQDIILEIDEGGPAFVSIDGARFPLEPEVGDEDDFIFDQDGQFVSVDSFISSGEALGAEVFFSEDDGPLNRSLVVIGFDTNPEVIASAQGSAEFTGPFIGTLVNGNDTAFTEGSFTLDVEFGSGTVSGTAQITDPEFSDSDFIFDTVNIELEPTRISQNGFAGSVGILSGTAEGQLVEGEYSGRFFGPEGEDIGGQVTGQFNLDNVENDTFFEGVFVGPQTDE